ncbi:MAG: hypothetical protein M3081_09855, partial [Gemmatimonadota bacterium]|nr:hypothetical protein [Gemmatimonadota bacterium]
EDAAPRQLQIRDGDRRARERRDPLPGENAERMIVKIMLLFPDATERIAETVGEADFTTPMYRELYGALLEHGAPLRFEGLSEESVIAAQLMLAEPNEIVDLDQSLQGSVNNLRVRELRREIEEMQRLIDMKPPEIDALIKRKQEIVGEIRALGGTVPKNFRRKTG